MSTILLGDKGINVPTATDDFEPISPIDATDLALVPCTNTHLMGSLFLFFFFSSFSFLFTLGFWVWLHFFFIPFHWVSRLRFFFFFFHFSQSFLFSVFPLLVLSKLYSVICCGVEGVGGVNGRICYDGLV